MRRSNVLNVEVRVNFGPPSHEERTELGAKYAAVATVHARPYDAVSARSYGKTQHAARKFAQAFALEEFAKKVLDAAERLEGAP